MMYDRAGWAVRWARCPVSADRCFVRCPVRAACDQGLAAHERAMRKVDVELVLALARLLRGRARRV